MKRIIRRNIFKHFVVLFLTILFGVSTLGLFLKGGPEVNAHPINSTDILEFDGNFDWDVTLDVQTSSSDYITYSDFRDTYCLWNDSTYSPSACASAANGKKIRFDTAEELYRFSLDVSFDEIYITGNPTEDQKLSDTKIAVLLSLDYVLGDNIDYSIMQSKAFIPIGYAFTDVAENVYERSFTGTFDGQGFEIENLYVAGYDYLIYEDIYEGTPIDIALSEHYSMFNYNEGIIRNLGLVDPNLEISNLHTDITMLSNLVGFNMTNLSNSSDISFTSSTKTISSTNIDLSIFAAGDLIKISNSNSNDGIYTVTGTPSANSLTVQESLVDEVAGTSINLEKPGVVENVYVVDTRTSVTEAGMRYSVGTYSGDFQAAGILHTNQGVFRSSYYSSILVMNGYYVNKFSVQPVVYLNQGTVSNLVYDSDVYKYPTVTVNYQTFFIDTPNSYALGETTATLKSTSSSLSSLTHIEDGITKNIWYFYSNDGYPLLNGFEYSNGNYLIYNAIDFKFFADVLSFTTVNYDTNSMTYKNSDFILMNSIDMSEISDTSYNIPTSTFYGTLSGYNPLAADLSENYYIYNLNITDGILRGEEYIAGLFSVLGAGSEITNLNFSQSSVSFENTNSNYSKDFYIGALAGKMTGGTIDNVLVDVDVDLGTQALGKTYAGSLVGLASGIIDNVSNFGALTGNTHVYQSQYIIEPKYYIGGIVGACTSAQLSMTDVVNNGSISGFSTSSTFTLETGSTDMEIYLGGIIGYINNTDTIEHQLVNVANKANIYIGSVIDSVSVPSTQYVGGIFGLLEGVAPVLESDSVYKFANFYNSGTIYHTYNTNTADIKSAGIGVNNSNEAIEYALLFNHSGFDFTEGSATYSQTQFRYAALIYDISSSNVTISRAYNYANFNYDKNVYNEISPLYISENDNSTLLRFVTNYGDINYLNNSGNTQISLASDLSISGITLESNVNYSNVYNYGDISVVNINLGSYDLYVAGFAKELADNHYLKKSLSDSNISVAEISGSGNIYIAGLVNTNFSGDLHDASQSPTQPQATEGIFDSMNSGNISTSYGLEAAGLYGIHGTSNLFIGGIATLNKGSIQDSGNLGDIRAYNSYSSGTFTYSTETYYAGLISSYSAGITAGGIVGVVIGGNSRIYDTANNGDVIVTTYKYVRAGGVLGVCLYDEADAGGITSAMGLTNDIEDSILSNGMNFGNISALSNTIASYPTSTYSNSFSIYANGSTYNSFSQYWFSTTGNDDRPPIYSSAGGVIGYGLSVMQNMLNHGTISATDVAGGVVGSTYVLGSSSGSVTTVVNITTAINYGEIKSIDSSDVSSINKHSLSTTEVETIYMSDGNSFIFPANYTPEMPLGKRGFGGIFGRLQRGTNGVMTSEGGSFDFIVNADQHIDLIGRLDQVQNFSSSSRFYRFNDAIYYSAKIDDTTQTVFTGYYYTYATVNSRASSSPYIYTVTAGSTYAQVGNVSTYVGTNSDQFTFESTSSYSTNTTRYVYYKQIEIPWITEDPNDPNITDIDNQYMYDPDFPMRTNPNLTEYIYFMTNDLLATRFTSSRPNGMYVLSTTAGQSYGLVLPRNIDIDLIRPINEDYPSQISLLIDYDVVSPIYKELFSTEIENSFDSLKQTNFNDKAEIVASDTQNVIIEENGGSSNILNNPNVDYVNKTLTYTISIEAFSPSQTTASFNVSAALTSSGALIAMRAYDYYGYTPNNSELEAFRLLLYPERNNGISTSYAADLSVTLPSQSITSNVSISVGYFSVYSEAFIGDDLYAREVYYNSYQVIIIFTPASDQLPGTTRIENVAFNGGGQVSVPDYTDLRSLGDVNSLGSITLYFEDTKGILTEDYDFKNNFVVYYNGTILSNSYYTVTSTPVSIVSSVGYYNITFTFTGVTIAGDYYFVYSYFPTSTQYTTYFDKAASSNNTISDFSYYSESNSIEFSGNVITSYLNLGYSIEDYMDSLTNNFSSTINGGYANYESNVTYNIDFMTNGSLVISAFAEVVSARLVSVTITNGYKTYQMEYIIEAENGSQRVYTHNLIERTVDLVSVLKDGNNVVLSNIHTSREALSTEFTVDLGFDQNLDLYIVEPGAYSYIEVSVTGTSNDGLTTYTSEQILNITYSASDYLYITMTYETLPGIYTFSFKYYRDGSSTDYVNFATTLIIEKDLGTDAYLTDVKFSDIPSETTYPDISIVDSSGNPKTTGYDPVIYFNGIDYDGADSTESYFRIDGAVNNIPLDSYVPYMLDYLPYGATLSRYAYDTNLSSWYWTSEASNASSESIKSELSTNFTVYPDTGLEPAEGDLVRILYRVTAEDGLTQVFYYITVVDVTYNLTVVFDIYYCTGAGEETCTLAKDSVDFSNELIILTVKNIDTDGNELTPSDSNPANFPTFTTIEALNNNTTQFFYTSSADYGYKFGRNMSGFYTFDVELQLDKYLNDIYYYEIKYGDYYLNDASNYIAGLSGKYYYIGPSITMRTRRFNIYIREVTSPETDAPFGLFDFFKSWFYE